MYHSSLKSNLESISTPDERAAIPTAPRALALSTLTQPVLSIREIQDGVFSITFVVLSTVFATPSSILIILSDIFSSISKLTPPTLIKPLPNLLPEISSIVFITRVLVIPNIEAPIKYAISPAIAPISPICIAILSISSAILLIICAFGVTFVSDKASIA